MLDRIQKRIQVWVEFAVEVLSALIVGLLILWGKTIFLRLAFDPTATDGLSSVLYDLYNLIFTIAALAVVLGIAKHSFDFLILIWKGHGQASCKNGLSEAKCEK